MICGESMSKMKPPLSEAPIAFPLDAAAKHSPPVIEEPDFTLPPEKPAPDAGMKAARSGWLGALLLGSLSALVSLFVVDALWGLVERLFAKSPLLGQVTLVLAGIAGLILLTFILREVFATLRLRRVSFLQVEAMRVNRSPQKAEVARFSRLLAAFYADDPACAAGRAKLAEALGDLHDPATLLAITERALLAQKDDAARAAIVAAAQRVSLVTALSPRAIIDLLFVLGQAFALIRTLSHLYGGRASGVGLLRLVTQVGGHLVVTGGMAMADTALSQVVGAGVAARLSAKLGEGVVNGILTARIGLAAVELCRPMPFIVCDPIILSQVVKSAVFTQKVAENTAP
jgi:putative membrane protein